MHARVVLIRIIIYRDFVVCNPVINEMPGEVPVAVRCGGIGNIGNSFQLSAFRNQATGTLFC